MGGSMSISEMVEMDKMKSEWTSFKNQKDKAVNLFQQISATTKWLSENEVFMTNASDEEKAMLQKYKDLANGS
jgi:hypothetical protein